MAAGIEVCGVVRFLEIELAEGRVADVYSAHAAVEDGNGAASGYLLDDVDDALHIGFVGIGPRREEEDAGLGIFADECVAEKSQPRPQQFLADGVGFGDVGRNAVGVVVAGDDDDIVERIAHLRGSLIDSLVVCAFAVYGDARAITSIVEINHAVFLGKFIVPGVGLRLMMVVDIAVTDEGDALTCQWVFLCLAAGGESCQQ